jgi:mRNA interferase MazF
VRQYEIWWAKLPAPVGERPVLLLSRDPAYRYLSKFLVVEITTTVRNIPTEVPLGSREGLPKRCVANCDNIRTVPRDRLIRRVGVLAAERTVELKRALGRALLWEELMHIGG